jgi:hypothetical protein
MKPRRPAGVMVRARLSRTVRSISVRSTGSPKPHRQRRRYAAGAGTGGHWRPWTIAEAQDQGALALLLGRRGTTQETFLGNIPLRCQRSGNAAPMIGVALATAATTELTDVTFRAPGRK